jgi:flagellar hook assembly protein FlgD
MPNNEFVIIEIYNILGNRVRSLLTSEQKAGFNYVMWDATNDLGQSVSAGMYIYTIQAGEFRQTRKMLLMK